MLHTWLETNCERVCLEPRQQPPFGATDVPSGPGALLIQATVCQKCTKGGMRCLDIDHIMTELLNSGTICFHVCVAPSDHLLH